MNCTTRSRLLPAAACTAAVLILTSPLAAQRSAADGVQQSYADMMGAELYDASCANCHGATGAGVPQTTLGFDTPPADFTDCSFASREPDGDWVGVAHEGGPLRGFFHMMPAFGDALTEEQLQSVIDYVRTLCGDDSWPRGDLNMPRPMVTEKAYPEDELVWTMETAVEGAGTALGEITYEKRFGRRGQFELVVPFGLRQQSGAGGDGWASGLGDVVLGWKHVLTHSYRRGSILSAAAELKLATGDAGRGFGAGTSVAEAFVSYGQLLPADAFVQLQGVVEVPFDQDVAGNEAALRVAVGKTFTRGRWGRAWSPMVEVLAARELESGATIHWDLVPQFQVTLNQRQHVMANLAVRVPVNDTVGRHPRVLLYVLWDWFDGGLLDGW
ncbi:MAG: cytochrome c [Gemmatimonadales bacterium]